MIEYRHFRNTDAPAIVEIWAKQPPLPAMIQPLPLSVLETTVLSKTCFDPRGLILAWEDGTPVGFAHAGFGPSRDGMAVDRSVGTTCLLLVVPHQKEQQIGAALLQQSERYLRDHGAERLLGGAVSSLAPFYLGLYGGASLPGIIMNDVRTLNFFRQAGYEEREQRLIWQCQLGHYRPVIDRMLLQLRRKHEVRMLDDPPMGSWWEACHAGRIERTLFTAFSKLNQQQVGQVCAWDMEPLAASHGMHARGLTRIDVAPHEDFELVAMYLVGEVLRMLSAAGATLVETQTGPDQANLIPVLQRQGFVQAGAGIVLEQSPVA
jgi:GNAT superfamily N-acetyltransferase